MWLCTSLGFFSIVQKDADTFHIRARCRADLEALAGRVGQVFNLPSEVHLEPVASYPGSDYPWRILCLSAELPQVFQVLAASITYPNFKSAIAADPVQRPKLSAYQDIHHRMSDWQENNYVQRSL
jgi:hypothetical protein